MLQICDVGCCVEGEEGGGSLTLDVARIMLATCLATWPLNIFLML
jgi:hypothetical protein